MGSKIATSVKYKIITLTHKTFFFLLEQIHTIINIYAYLELGYPYETGERQFNATLLFLDINSLS